MASLLRRLAWTGRAWPGQAWKPLTFSNSEFPKVLSQCNVEEELTPHYKESDYYPVLIGQVLRDRYQIVGKLGYGRFGTVWLARDLEKRRHVSLKLQLHSKAMRDYAGHEAAIHRRIFRAEGKHPGRNLVRGLLDSFEVAGPDGSHSCLVYYPLWEDVQTFLGRNPIMRLPKGAGALILHRLFLSLDFLHANCQVIHTDIKARNIMWATHVDDPVLARFEEEEQRNPSPRKTVKWQGRRTYLSRHLGIPRCIGQPVLCDFGTALVGDRKHLGTAQPDCYRAPEVIIQAPYSYEIDIWNVGCMVWDLFQGGTLFSDPGYEAYRSKAHLAEIIALLGPPPRSLIQQGARSHEWFTDAVTTCKLALLTGDFRGDISHLDQSPLEDRVSGLEGEDKEKFIAMMRKMLQWDPSKRASARELAQDEWILGHVGEPR
ncbi:serine/threonine-protein kinase SRPK3 [Colletotrichum sojae]|uniref:non-specific serine/threonine protein kinase n=1 Tax=Colletotrichum sojae TaxID=2175907 RepID=A0A8H6IRH1_9PEZI|nr:serine/threonine-protein kinase SRPK3 [Colletotrichum sojae]